MKRNDVDDLKFPFQKTAKARLLPMIPTTTRVPTISVYMMNV